MNYEMTDLRQRKQQDTKSSENDEEIICLDDAEKPSNNFQEMLEHILIYLETSLCGNTPQKREDLYGGLILINKAGVERFWMAADHPYVYLATHQDSWQEAIIEQHGNDLVCIGKEHVNLIVDLVYEHWKK